MGKLCNSFGTILSQNNRPVALELLPLQQTRPSPQRLIILLTTPKKGFALHAERYLVERFAHTLKKVWTTKRNIEQYGTSLNKSVLARWSGVISYRWFCILESFFDPLHLDIGILAAKVPQINKNGGTLLKEPPFEVLLDFLFRRVNTATLGTNLFSKYCEWIRYIERHANRTLRPRGEAPLSCVSSATTTGWVNPSCTWRGKVTCWMNLNSPWITTLNVHDSMDAVRHGATLSGNQQNPLSPRSNWWISAGL